MVKDYNLLKIVRFSEVTQWTVKHFFSLKLRSQFPLEEIGKHTFHITKKKKLFEEPEKKFRILGISNDIGMFDAYSELGVNINQPYIFVEDGCLAYNPYRINVGSIGLKTIKLKNDYISPAYVVIKCRETILPEYLFLVLKSHFFKKIISENTTGSVRQTLSYENLAAIKIPVPKSIMEQQSLVEEYKRLSNDCNIAREEAQQLEKSINEYLADTLGIIETKHIYKTGLSTIQFSEIEKWGIDFLLSNHVVYNTRFPTMPIYSICQSGSGGTPSRKTASYYGGSIPWIKTGELQDTVIFDTEEKITDEALRNSNAKIYPSGSIVIAMYGQGLTRGRTAMLGVDATTNQACLVLYNIDTTRVLPEYLWYYLQGEYYRLRALAYGNNQPNLNASIINNYPVVIPPIDSKEKAAITQVHIINEIRNRKKQINTLYKNATELENRAWSVFEEAIFGET